MKIFKYLTLIFLSTMVLSSCEDEEDNLDELKAFTISAAELSYPSENASIALNLEQAQSNIEFSWNPATTDSGFLVTYEFLLVEDGADLSDPLYSSASAESGKATYISIPQERLDEALSNAGLNSGESMDLSWAVVASAQQNSEISLRTISMTRFDFPETPEKLYIAGTATEVGDNPENGILLRRLFNANGDPINKYEGYTSLNSSGTFSFYGFQNRSLVFGGSNGTISAGGDPISPERTTTYRIRVDFINSTYELQPITWSIVGNVITNGWGGDVPMTYQGNGTWALTYEFIDADAGDPNDRFIFRANQDWGFVIKKLVGSNEVLAEDIANNQGITVDDIPLSQLGQATVTLNLSGQQPVYSINN
ncbi:SusE domain-containing protein [Nonlabens sp. YIK11]|uniref:SusE domain-containing protein n=1 Tax=Nonlabens sp. YIK11 TaxID=1453349 RepID=UPI0009EB9A0C|nr:SusE domain-containing protein [Nonlabens sp. YIK11]